MPVRGRCGVGHQLKKYRQDTISETLSHDFPPTVDTQPPHSDNTDGLILYKRFLKIWIRKKKKSRYADTLEYHKIMNEK